MLIGSSVQGVRARERERGGGRKFVFHTVVGLDHGSRVLGRTEPC